MSQWVYIRTEPRLWTVGLYRPDGKFEPESDHGSSDEAAKRVHYLNGGTEDDQLHAVATALTKAIERLGTDRARAMADLRRIINSDDPVEIDEIANACLDALLENAGVKPGEQ